MLKKYFLYAGERFDLDFCTKNKETGKRYWFACIVCPCTLYRDENLVHHVKGQKHQKRAIEKLNSENNVNRKRKRNDSEPLHEAFNPVPGFSRSSRSDLQHRLMHGPSYPFLGLEYITEYVNPGNPVSKIKSHPELWAVHQLLKLLSNRRFLATGIITTAQVMTSCPKLKLRIVFVWVFCSFLRFLRVL